MKTAQVLNFFFKGEGKAGLLKKIDQEFECLPEKATYNVGVTGVAISEDGKPKDIYQSLESFLPRILRTLESLSEQGLLNEDLCNELHQITQDFPGYKQCPSKPTIEDNGAPKFLSQEKRAVYYNRIAKTRARTATRDICSARRGHCLCKHLAECLKIDCARP